MIRKLILNAIFISLIFLIVLHLGVDFKNPEYWAIFALISAIQTNSMLD